MSTLCKIITLHSLDEIDIKWPEWFLTLYAKEIAIDQNGDLMFNNHGKWGRTARDLEKNIQKALTWKNEDEWFVIVVIHDCGGIDRGEIRRDFIRWTSPGEWLRADSPMHGSCDGCSDASKAIKTHPHQGWAVEW